jgi:hypothetical protein
MKHIFWIVFLLFSCTYGIHNKNDTISSSSYISNFALYNNDLAFSIIQKYKITNTIVSDINDLSNFCANNHINFDKDKYRIISISQNTKNSLYIRFTLKPYTFSNQTYQETNGIIFIIFGDASKININKKNNESIFTSLYFARDGLNNVKEADTTSDVMIYGYSATLYYERTIYIL